MKNRTVILASLLFAVACASNIAKSSEPPAVAEVKLVEMSPVAGSELMQETVLVAEIRYSIKNFKPGVDYYVAPVFASTEGAGVTFSMADRISDSTKILSPEGTVTVSYPVSRELASPHLARPVKVWFYVMERIGAGSTRVIGMTEELQYKAAAG